MNKRNSDKKKKNCEWKIDTLKNEKKQSVCIYTYIYICIYERVYMCVSERERERERELHTLTYKDSKEVRSQLYYSES